MKKIFYICRNPIDNWDIFIPNTNDDTTQTTISILFLKSDQNMEHIPVSEVWTLQKSQTDNIENNPHGSLSYQAFLEKIFSHDLSLVI